MQIIQFLGEFEYDLKTLKELINDYKNKYKIKCEQNIKSIKNELNNIKKENISLKQLIDIKNKNKYHKPNFQIRNNKKAEIKRNKNNNSEKNDNLEIRKEYYYTKSFNINKNKNKNSYSKISNNNNDRNPFFYDYNSFLSHIKNNDNTNNKFCKVIKYDIYKQKNKKNLKDNENINRSVRVKSVDYKNIYKNNNNLNEKTKQKIINKIFQDETIINALKNNFGNEIEDKLLNDDINIELLSKIEEISENIKNNNNIRNRNINNETIQESNRSYNLKIPKRYSNNKDNNFVSNFIISS